MNIKIYNSLASTHLYLSNNVNNYDDICIVAKTQTNGIGSRSNIWESNSRNLFFTFSFTKNKLPKDLHLSSISIYFAYIMNSVLNSLGSKVWLKWPNDFHLKQDKIGGVMSSVKKDKIICSMGINTYTPSEISNTLDIRVDNLLLLSKFINIISINKLPSWSEVFKDFKIQFINNKDKMFTTIDNQKRSLSDASLYEDGSIIVNHKKVYSLR